MSGESEPQTGIYTIQSINGLVENLKRPKTFFLDTFFPNVLTSPNEVINVDVEIGHRKSAPFVAPRSQAQHIRLPGYKTKSFTPPTVKVIVDLNPRRALKRAAGEKIGGDRTPKDRAAEALSLAVNEVNTLIVRTQEHMAIDAVVNGSTTVMGEGYPEPVVVDFGRDAALQVTLPQAKQWGKPGAKPLQDIEDMGLVGQKVEGVQITHVVMDIDAWRLMRVDPEVERILQVRRATGGNSADLGPGNYAKGAKMVADMGDYTIWVYVDFKDVVSVDRTTGEVTVTEGVPVLPSGTVIGLSGIPGGGVDGTRLFGALEDIEAIEAGLAATEIFTKTWVDRMVGVRYVMGQSAPLPTPFRPNATWSLKVK